jgi:hypothetical protein
MMAKTYSMKSEKQLHKQVCKYLDLRYPDVIYLSDPSGMRVSIGLQMEIKAKRCKRYKVPDLIILHPNARYKALIFEIKKDLAELVTKSGDIRKSKHIQEQLRSLERLQEIGYAAVFGVSFEQIKSVIDEYFNPKNQ